MSIYLINEFSGKTIYDNPEMNTTPVLSLFKEHDFLCYDNNVIGGMTLN
jgi:hypothetical protein